MRASNGRLMVVTQRPDTEDAIPGSVRDMLEDRIILGFVSGTGARMVLDRDWQTVVDEYGVDPVPGRGMARIGGKLTRIQGFRLALPREHPEAEQFYPPRVADPVGSGQSSPRPGGVPRSTVGRWASRPSTPDPSAAASAAGASQDRGSDDAPTPRYGIPLSPADADDNGRQGRPGGRRRTV
jgi:hypothetical protein